MSLTPRFPGRVFSREQLLDAVWGQDVYVERRTVDVHIRRLRKALNAYGGADIVRTVRSAGYAIHRPTHQRVVSQLHLLTTACPARCLLVANRYPLRHIGEGGCQKIGKTQGRGCIGTAFFETRPVGRSS